MSLPRFILKARRFKVVKALTRRQLLRELEAQAIIYRESYAEVDGQIRNHIALTAIAALESAIALLSAPLRPGVKKKTHATRKGSQ